MSSADAGFLLGTIPTRDCPDICHLYLRNLRKPVALLSKQASWSQHVPKLDHFPDHPPALSRKRAQRRREELAGLTAHRPSPASLYPRRPSKARRKVARNPPSPPPRPLQPTATRSPRCKLERRAQALRDVGHEDKHHPTDLYQMDHLTPLCLMVPCPTAPCQIVRRLPRSLHQNTALPPVRRARPAPPVAIPREQVQRARRPHRVVVPRPHVRKRQPLPSVAVMSEIGLGNTEEVVERVGVAALRDEERSMDCS